VLSVSDKPDGTALIATGGIIGGILLFAIAHGLKKLALIERHLRPAAPD
jgi:hypothetical protein